MTGASKGIGRSNSEKALSDERTGIGLAITRYILSQGHNIVIVARSRDLLDKIRDEHPKQVRVLDGDMQDLSIASEAVSLATKEFRGLDGLIINHGTMDPVVRIENCNPQDWSSLFAVNLFSAVAFVSMFCSRHKGSLTVSRPKQQFHTFVNQKAR